MIIRKCKYYLLLKTESDQYSGFYRRSCKAGRMQLLPYVLEYLPSIDERCVNDTDYPVDYGNLE